MTVMTVEDTQLVALIVQSIGAALLAAIVYIVRRAYIGIRDLLLDVREVKEEVGALKENDALRAGQYQMIRDELMYLKGKVGVPIDEPVTGTAEVNGK